MAIHRFFRMDSNPILSSVQESVLCWPHFFSSMGNAKRGNPAICHGPWTKWAKRCAMSSQCPSCQFMPSTFGWARMVTPLKYACARETLWNNNVTCSLFPLSNEEVESNQMGCVKQGGRWYFWQKHMQNFDIVDWRCKGEREPPRFILSLGCWVLTDLPT